MDGEKNKKKIAVVGCSLNRIAETRALEQILKERGLTIDDVVVIDSETRKDKEKTMEIIRNSDKPILFSDSNLIIENPKQEVFQITDPYKDFRKEPMYYPTLKEVENYHPFSKFIGKGNKKRKK